MPVVILKASRPIRSVVRHYVPDELESTAKISSQPDDFEEFTTANFDEFQTDDDSEGGHRFSSRFLEEFSLVDEAEHEFPELPEYHDSEEQSSNASEMPSHADSAEDHDAKEHEFHEEEYVLRSVAEENVQEAYNRGFTDGQIVAGKLLEKDFAEQQRRFKDYDEVITGLQEQYSAAIAQLETTVVAFGLMVAEQVIGSRTEADTQLAVEQARKALSKMDGIDAVTIRVHPDQVEVMKIAQSDLLQEFTGVRLIRVESDERVALGGVILETAMGQIDAQIHTQFERVVRALMRSR